MNQDIRPLPEDFIGQFESSSVPFWVVNKSFDVLHFNKRAEALRPESRLSDGLRVCFSPADCEEIVRLIALGDSFNSAPSVNTTAPAVTFSFTPYRQDGRVAGAFVLLAPLTEEPDSIMDLHQTLLTASTLVVTRELKKNVSEIFYSLAACASKLRAAKVDLADEQLRAINKSCYRILRDTSNISERIKYASNLFPATRPLDFWTNCAELLEASGTVLRARNFIFSYELPESTVYVNCDFEKISIAILHLISNAYTHCPQDVQVSVTGRDTPDGVLVAVADNGPGIPADIQSRIFQPFSWGGPDQEDTTMGLGLNIVRNIVTQANGKLAMSSDEDGTTMALSLPASAPPGAASQLFSTSASYMQDRFSMLYVILSGVISPPDP